MILALSSIRYHTFLLLLIIGHIPRYLILNLIGRDLYAGFTTQTIVVILAGGVLLLIAVFREPLKRLMFKELKEVEHEVEKVEKNIRL
jgi:uncharacterized membrane protein YdjX (TVP38/TMEM64 family)